MLVSEITLSIEKKNKEFFLFFEVWTKNNVYPFLQLKEVLLELNS